MGNDLKQIEDDVRQIEGVMGVLILEDNVPGTFEVHVYTRAGVKERSTRQSIGEVLDRHGRLQSAERVYVFELSGEKIPQSMKSLRPAIGKIVLNTSGQNAQARVSLVLGTQESEGSGDGPTTNHAMRVVAATTLEAAQAFLGQSGIFYLEGVSLVEALTQRVVLVLVKSALGEGGQVLGSCLVGSEPIEEAVVRAALDAVNRHLSLALSS